MHESKSQSDWEQLLLKWTKWGVLGYMRSYLALFFPGREEEAIKIGLMKPDDDEQVNLFKNDEEVKDNEDELDLI